MLFSAYGSGRWHWLACIHGADFSAGAALGAQLRVDRIGAAFGYGPFGALRKADAAGYAFR